MRKELSVILICLLLSASIQTMASDISRNCTDDIHLMPNRHISLDQALLINSTKNKNILLSSDNPNNDDNYPRIVNKNDRIQVVIYEKTNGSNLISNPIIISDDYGQNWTEKFDISSTLLNKDNHSTFPGITTYPNLIYNPYLDIFYYSSIDPEAEMYNNIMGFIKGNIESTDEIILYAISACGEEYLENTASSTNNFFLSMNIRNGYHSNRHLDLYYVTYPDFEHPPVMGGCYPDGESVHRTSPASNIEMDTSNRIYLVAETDMGPTSKITVKSTTANEQLLINGELQDGMDKYADIEQWPGEYIATGSDPDVSAYGNKVFVVYIQNDSLKCSYSTAESGYQPKYSWKESVIDTGNVKCPALYAVGENIICAYVKDNNLFLIQSKNGGVSWEQPDQINEVEYAVVDESRSIDVNDAGVVWTDIRNGQKDIYYQSIKTDFFIPEITIAGGLGITITIENKGNLAMDDVELTMAIDAFLIKGFETSTNFSICAYGTVKIHMYSFGLGGIQIEVKCDGNGYASASGVLLGPLVILK